jgi:nucleoid-associated protein YgaU
MQRRSKILVIAVVAGMAGGATYFFRKGDPTPGDVASPPAQAEVERRAIEKPAPQSHLLGEIQAANQPTASGDLAPIAPATSALPTAAAPANPFNTPSATPVGPPAAAQVTSTPPLAKTSPPAGAADNQFFPPGTGATAPSGGSSFAASAPIGSPSEVLRHKIVDGDTLTGLAERYLGNSNRYLELYEMNREKLTSPDLLPIGAEIKVPARGLVAPTPTTEAPQPMVPLAPAG